MAENKKKKSDEYGAKDITVLKGLEAVRRRPGMYIGTTGDAGLHQLLTEVFDNGRDEAMGGYADRIEVVLLPDSTVRVSDNGRGIPVDIHSDTKVSALETIMTTLHAGGKFGGKSYTVSGGLHGVGVSVVNALSTDTEAIVYRDGGIYQQKYKKGERVAKVKKIGTTKLNGTSITFKPDFDIMETKEFNKDTITTYLRQQAYLVSNLRVTLIDLRESESLLKKTSNEDLFWEKFKFEVPTETYFFEGGIRSMVRFYNKQHRIVHENIFHISAKQGDQEVEIAFQYVDDIQSKILTFANNIHTPEGGTHLTGFKSALTRVMNSYAKENKIFKSADGSFTSEDVYEGLTAIISVKLPEVQFEGQTKAKLGSTEVRKVVETLFAKSLSEFLEEYPTEAKSITKKLLLAYDARKAAKSAKDSVLRKGALEGFTLPGKLSDCHTRNPDEAELFIVEGQSAGGSAKLGRDRRTQAILPLKGKILNGEKARLDRMVASDEITSLVISRGTAIESSFDSSKLRYGKIIIATDADVDGAHIRALLLTLFYRHFRELIENGNVYIAQPPLFKIQQGKTKVYAFSDAERDKVIAKLEKKGNVSVQRYKGLGEMDYTELWETTMNPENRVLLQVKIANDEEADGVFDTLMGTEVAPRRLFIQSNAKYATLDI